MNILTAHNFANQQVEKPTIAQKIHRVIWCSLELPRDIHITTSPRISTRDLQAVAFIRKCLRHGGLGPTLVDSILTATCFRKDEGSNESSCERH